MTPVARDRGSLAARTARTIILWCCLATAVATGIGYLILSHKGEQQVLERLSEYIDQRGRAESLIFQTARSNLDIFADRYLAVYRDQEALQQPDFGRYFFEDEHGAIRLRKAYFDGLRGPDGINRSGVSGFIGRKRPPLTAEFQRRLVIGYQLLAQFGPGWSGQFANLHVSYPENALLMYWPQEPWGLDADPGLDMTAGSVIKSTLQPHNPTRSPVWSGLYYDLTAQKWAVTYQRPLDWGGRHLVNPSHDIFLDGLIHRLSEGHPPGARNLILAQNGDLIAQPERMDDILRQKGVLNVKTLGDPDLSAVFDTLSRARGSGPRILESEALDAYIAVATIDGPNWWYVAVYPRSLIAAEARSTTRILLVLALALSAIITAVVLLVLRLRVSRPMGQMKRAAEAVARGDYRDVVSGELPLPDNDDEIGVLADSFRDMAEQVENQSQILERKVDERTSQLAITTRDLERLLNEREALHERYQQATGFVAIVEGRDHRFTLTNPALRTFFGDREVLGQALGDVIPELADQGFVRALDGIYETGEARSGQAVPIRLRGQDEDAYRQVYIDTVCQPIRNPSGEVIGIFIEGHDVTVQRMAQDRITALQAQLIQLSRVSAMGAMGATLAHELNQPLTAISNYASALLKLLKKGGDAQRVHLVADSIARSALLAGEIIRSLRRMAAGQGLRKQVASVGQLVSEATALSLLDAPAGARIDLDLQDGLEFMVDPVQIQQVLLNLVRNAFEAATSSGRLIVLVSSHVDEKGIVISVADDGDGIADDIHPYLFDSFFTTKSAGAGIGLSISRTIIEAHGGTIWARNKEDGGAIFCFRIPHDDPAEASAARP